jgi:hypothetical protein
MWRTVAMITTFLTGSLPHASCPRHTLQEQAEQQAAARDAMRALRADRALINGSQRNQPPPAGLKRSGFTLHLVLMIRFRLW